MKRRKLYICILLVCCVPFMYFSCASTEKNGTASEKEEITNIPFEEFMEKEGGRLWTSLPEDGNPVFLGYSINFFDDDRETREALETAAVYASAYSWLYGETGFLDSRKGQFSYTEVKYDTDRVEDLIGNLEIVDTFRDKKGTVILAKLKEASAPAYGYNPVPNGYKRGKAPEWTRILPSIEGYYVSVGVTDKKYDLATSFLAADKQALAELLRQINLKTKAGKAEQVIDKVGQINTEVSSQRSQAELNGVYILARYQSEDGKYFYTLAVSPKK